MFRSVMQKIPKKRDKRVFSLSFLDPSSPRLAFGSPGPPDDFRLKELARLGEPVTSGVSLSSSRQAAMVPSPLFSINRREGELRKGFQGQKLRELREERKKKKKKKEEETKPRRYRITTTIIPYFVSCSAFFV